MHSVTLNLNVCVISVCLLGRHGNVITGVLLSVILLHFKTSRLLCL